MDQNIVNRVGTIYVLKNKINGKMYVGQTTNLKDRLVGHKYGNYPINKAVQKYGINGFEITHFDNYPIELLDPLEKDFIRILNTKTPNGYNVMGGGQKSREFQYEHIPDEVKAKISASLKLVIHTPEWGHRISLGAKGKKRTEEQRRTMSENRKGKPNLGNRGRKYTEEQRKKMHHFPKGNIPWNKGIYTSEETRRKNSESNKGRIAPNKIKIMCVETREIFISITEAVNKYGGAIRQALDNPNKTSSNFHWIKISKKDSNADII